MTGPQLTILFCAVLVICAGSYMTFVAGESIGAVFLGLGATLAAVSSMVGAAAKANKKDGSDAG